MSIPEELDQLAQLHAEGKLTDIEFQEAKAKILEEEPKASFYNPFRSQPGAEVDPEEINTYCMWIHLSQLAGFVVPFAGVVIPIVLWQIRLRDSKIIDLHGRAVTNWIISSIIYAVVFTVLIYVLIGFPLLAALLIASLAFPIYGSLQAQKGNVWKYPGAIRFIGNPDDTPKRRYKSDRKQDDFRSNQPNSQAHLNGS